VSAEEDPPHAAVVPPPAFLSAPAPAAVLAALPGARAVGGCVRDALAGRPVHDVDVAAPLPPEGIMPLLRRAGMKVFETGLAHGTVTAVLGGQPVEVTSLRRDVATDGRHAEVAWTADWREDAARRDFTINAMSLAADGRLWDYFGGRDDLAAGRVRFVGDPATRLREDYLRALRFFRFQARYGRGEPDRAALAAIRAAVPGLARLSAERVWMELKRLFQAPNPADAVALMAETGVLGTWLPEATPPQLQALRRLASADAPRDAALWLAAMLPPESSGFAAEIAGRLRMSNEERKDFISLHYAEASNPSTPGSSETERRAWLISRDMPITAMQEAWLAEARDGKDRSDLRRWIDATPWPSFPIFGRDVVALGIEPGPRIGQLLREVKGWWSKGGGVADRDACLQKLRELAAARPI
jgi:poly(A) polymerase/tRNA nucleotidyltransferase (CCA-adding enzyme)